MAATYKIGSLLLKTLSKPLASSLKRRAQQSRRFEKFCINLAQNYNRIDSRLKQNWLDYKSEPIKPLSEARAVELGANFLSELIIFGVGALTILAETVRSTHSIKAKKVLAEERLHHHEIELAELKNGYDELRVHYDELRLHTERMEAAISELLKSKESELLKSKEYIKQKNN